MNERKKPSLRPVCLAALLLLACSLGSQPPAATQPPAVDETQPPVEATAPDATEPPTTEAPVADATQPPTAEPTAVPAPAFQVLAIANRDPAQAAFSPALAVGSTTPDGPLTAWLAWAENFSADSRQIFVSELVDGALQARGASLNIHLNVHAEGPAITFAGEGNAVPWVSWVEPSPGFGDQPNIFASRFNAASGLWQPAGQDRGGGEPSLNSETNRAAGSSAVAGGSGDPAVPDLPWVAWEELGRLSNFTQLFVSKGVRDDTGLGGFLWEQVGLLRHNDEPTLNVDPFRHALNPTIVFAETGNAVPWVTWHEEGGSTAARIFTARGVADANVPGGFEWVFTPACDPDETACALNINPLRDAKDAAMAAGSVTAGEAGVPWIAWAEIGPTGKWQVFVSRLDPANRASFVNVGASLNVDPNQDARFPQIVFVGTVPYVAWLEDDGSGTFRVHLRHLASDPQTGNWELDSPEGGFDADAALPNSQLVIATDGVVLYLAWVEGDPAAVASQVVLAVFRP